MDGSWSCLNCGLKPAICASSIPLSNYRHTITKFVEVENSSRSIEEQIEHSKTHWNQLANSELDGDEVVEVSNVEVFRALQLHPKWGTFFQTFGKDGIGELMMGQKFAEGGQAELYDVEIQWNDPRSKELDFRLRLRWLLKVFKKGTSLRQLQLQWPHGLLEDHVDRRESTRRGDLPKRNHTSDVFLGILLEDGRFAFLMMKEYEDLRHQIDCIMLTTSKNCCPYLKENVEAIIYRVASGMEWLHSRGIIHQDLKSSNVLRVKLEIGWICAMADFDCSIGVIGTRFLGLLKYCKHARIIALATSLNCLRKKLMSIIMGWCVMRS